jgi:hypothetical protein
MPGKRISFKQRAKIQVLLENIRNTSLAKIAKETGLKGVVFIKKSCLGEYR